MSINIKSPHEYINATVVGTPTISEGVVSGFSIANYLAIADTFPIEDKPWEFTTKFNLSDVTTEQRIFGGNGNVFGLAVQIKSGKLDVYASSNGSSWNVLINQTGVTTFEVNKDYWLKFEYTGERYVASISTDGSGWSTEFSVGSTTPLRNFGTVYLGCNATSLTFSGSIDLNESYIKINGEYWWRGVEVDQYKEIKRLYKYDQPRYFKNVTEITYEDWTQPTLSTDGTVGGDSYACRADSEYKTDAATYQAYKAFDKNTGTFWSSSSKTSGWLEFYSPVAILPTKVTLTNRSSATNPFKNVTVTGSLDGSEYFTLATYTNANSSNSAAWDIVIDNPQTVKYVRVAGSGLVTSNTLSQAEMLVTATQEIVTTSTVEVTANDDYDYIEQNPMLIKQVYKTGKPKYYKRVWGDNVDVNTPVFASQTEATEGLDGVKFLTSQNCYTITNSSNKAINNGTLITIDVGELTDGIKSVGYTPIVVGDGYPALVMKNVQCSVDNSEWVTITSSYGGRNVSLSSPLTISYPNKYRYLRFTTGNDDSRHGNGGIKNFRINYVKTPKKTYEVNLGGEDVYGDWEQPILTANGTMGGDSFAVSTKDANSSYPAYKAFDGIKSDFGAIFTKTSGYLEFYNPNPLIVSSLSILNFAGDTYGIRSIKAGYIQARNDNEEYQTIKEFTNTILSGSATWNIDLSDNNTGYKYYRIVGTDTSYANSAASNQVAITELTITAQELKKIGGNEYDYSELIPTLVYEHNPTVFQQSTAGTYTFNVTEEAPYEITLVGGGGGGAFNSSGNAGSAAAGNSGSGLVVNAVLKAGTYVLNVGAGGAWSGWLDANTWGGNGSQSSISKDGVVIATAGGGTGNHAWWRSGSAHNSTVGAAPTYTDALGVRDVILNTQGNWGGLAATSSGGASVISGTTWGKGGDTRNRNAADNGNAGCIRIVRLEK